MLKGGLKSIADGNADSESKESRIYFLRALGGINDVKRLHCRQNWQVVVGRALRRQCGGLVIFPRIGTALSSPLFIRRAPGTLVPLGLLLLGAACAAAAAAAAAIVCLMFLGLLALGFLALFFGLLGRSGQKYAHCWGVWGPDSLIRMATGITICWFRRARDGTRAGRIQIHCPVFQSSRLD